MLAPMTFSLPPSCPHPHSHAHIPSPTPVPYCGPCGRRCRGAGSPMHRWSWEGSTLFCTHRAWRTRCPGSLRTRLVSTVRGVQIRAFVQDGPGSGTPEGIPVPHLSEQRLFPAPSPPLSPPGGLRCRWMPLFGNSYILGTFFSAGAAQ